jgi:hypothetical protein
MAHGSLGMLRMGVERLPMFLTRERHSTVSEPVRNVPMGPCHCASFLNWDSFCAAWSGGDLGLCGVHNFKIASPLLR